MRLDKPIGTLLLLWPTMWALWFASDGRPMGAVVCHSNRSVPIGFVEPHQALVQRQPGSECGEDHGEHIVAPQASRS